MKISKTAFQGDGDEDGSPTRRFIQRFVVGILPKHSDFAFLCHCSTSYLFTLDIFLKVSPLSILSPSLGF